MGNSFEDRLVRRLAALREERALSLEELAAQSGISRATLSRLIAEVEQSPVQLIRCQEQAEWHDPATGFVRRMVSPPARGFKAELIEGRLPPGALIDYAQPPVRGLEQHMWMLSGVLDYTIDGSTHRLQPGDCLRFQLYGATRFSCPGPDAAHYLIAICEP